MSVENIGDNNTLSTVVGETGGSFPATSVQPETTNGNDIQRTAGVGMVLNLSRSAGVGMLLKVSDHGLDITEILPNGPLTRLKYADRVCVGDNLTKVDGKVVGDLNSDKETLTVL